MEKSVVSSQMLLNLHALQLLQCSVSLRQDWLHVNTYGSRGRAHVQPGLRGQTLTIHGPGMIEENISGRYIMPVRSDMFGCFD